MCSMEEESFPSLLLNSLAVADSPVTRRGRHALGVQAEALSLDVGGDGLGLNCTCYPIAIQLGGSE